MKAADSKPLTVPYAGRAPSDRASVAQAGGSIGLVLLIALILVGAAGGLLFIGRANAQPYILALLAVLAMVGVFLLFALAAGILRVPGREAASPLLKAVVDGAGDGILVTDAGGRVVYANAAYLTLVAAPDCDDVRPVERVFIGDPGVSESVYRLLKAARDGRRGQEEVRVGAHKGEEGRWLRIRVRPLGAGKRESRMTVWSLADVTRELERHENVFQELQHAIDYLDHAPAGFFAADGGGNIVYLNATLASWLDHDLAQVGSGGLKLDDIVAGEGTALLTTLAVVPGDVKTEIFDIDLKTRSGRTLPVRLFHKVAFSADGTPGIRAPSFSTGRATMAAIPSVPPRCASCASSRTRRWRSRPWTGRAGSRNSNARFAHLFHSAFKNGSSADRSILTVVAERDRATLEAAIRKAAEGQGEIAPVDAALAGAGERFATFFVIAVEDEKARDREAAIVYALETTEQRTLENQVNQQQKMETIGRLAGNIAHDFNNLLGAIMMATDFLLNAHRPTDPSFQDIMQIKQNANRAASLVRQLLAFSRKQTMRPQVIDLGEALSDLTVLLRRLIGEKVTLDVPQVRDLWPVKADVGQFEQVIINLAVNARDAMPQRRQAHLAHVERARRGQRSFPGQRDAARRIRAGRSRGYRHRHRAGDHRQDLRPVLHHQGHRQGHRPRALDRLRHRQADRRLHLCRLGGRQRHDVPHFSAPLHRRSRRRRDAASARDHRARDRRRHFRGRRGHAHGGNRSHRTGHDSPGRGRGGAARAQCARLALARLYGAAKPATGSRRWRSSKRQGGHVDLVVSDVVMPEMDGPTLMKELRKRNPDIKIIFVSGYAEDAFDKSLPDQKQFDFLPKPFTLKQLVSVVKETMAGSAIILRLRP